MYQQRRSSIWVQTNIIFIQISAVSTGFNSLIVLFRQQWTMQTSVTVFGLLLIASSYGRVVNNFGVSVVLQSIQVFSWYLWKVHLVFLFTTGTELHRVLLQRL